MNELATPITISYGDGIGSEIMESVLMLLRESGANISVETIEIGQRIYNMGAKYGILPSAWEILRRNRVLLKAPVIIPHSTDYEYKDIDEIIYKKFSLSSENLYICNIIPEEYGADWLAGTENIGENFALFGVLHDSAPEIAGKNIANPSAMIQAIIMMLNHIGQGDAAELIRRAWLQTINEGIHTADMYNKKISRKKVGTAEFVESIIEKIGKYRYYSG